MITCPCVFTSFIFKSVNAFSALIYTYAVKGLGETLMPNSLAVTIGTLVATPDKLFFLKQGSGQKCYVLSGNQEQHSPHLFLFVPSRLHKMVAVH